jgi:hypothetical protein
MVCSARGALGPFCTVAAPLASIALASCTTTQQEAARLQLNNDRIRASQVATRIAAPSAEVAAASVRLIATPGRRTFVVALRNLSPTPTSDNPIVVGVVGADGHARPLNAAANLPYFDAHTPSLPARGELRWVLTTRAPVDGASRPYAIVGPRTVPSPSVPASLPSISVALLNRAEHPGGARVDLRVRVHNGSSIPQYQLPVYAIATLNGRTVAAGTAAVPELGASSTAVVRVSVFGNTTGAHLELEASPTIFR